MKRKLIACLLSLSLLCSLLPTFALATSADEDPTGTLSVICPVCETENCTDHIPCTTCGEYNCTVDHSVMPANEPETCTTCGQADCDGQHENWCDICQKDNCGEDHSTPTTCTTCGQLDCTSQHENWCDACLKDNCGVDHSVMPANEGEAGEEEQESSFYQTLINAETFEVLYGLMTDTTNSVSLSALSYEQLNAVDGKIDPLYELLAKKDADTEYQRKLLHGQIETLIAQSDDTFAALIDSCTCFANKSRLVIHATDCRAYIAPPDASVTAIGTSVTGGYEFTTKVDPFTMDLTYAMQFATQESYTDLQEAYYGTWVADFVITTNKRITGADAYLAGQYDIFNEFHNDAEKRWVKISVPANEALEADVPLQLIPMVTGQTFPFLGVVEFIPTFNCGIWVSESYLQDNPGFAVSVELRLYPSTDGTNYDDEVYYTLSKINYQSTNATINYIAGANGAVDVTTETVGTLVHPSGSTPTANAGYHFAGWYSDAEYKNAVPSDWVDASTGKLTPGTNASGTYDSATYYAKFDPDTISVTVTVNNSTSGTTAGETYLFELSGTANDGTPVSLQFVAKAGEDLKIIGLPDGKYTVKPISGWNGQQGTGDTTGEAVNGEADVNISASSGNSKWFSGSAHATRIF